LPIILTIYIIEDKWCIFYENIHVYSTLFPNRVSSGPSADEGAVGSKKNLLVDAHGIPLSIVVTGANRHDSVVLEELLHQRVVPLDFDHYDRITQNLCLDAGYVGKAYAASNEGMTPHVRPRGEEKKAIELHGFKPKRWIVEVAHSWFNRFRKIHTRYEKTDMAYCGLLHLAAAMITMNKGMKIYPAM